MTHNLQTKQPSPATNQIASPTRGNLLQRKCACGNASATGECEACKKKRPGLLQRSAVSEAPVPKMPAIGNLRIGSPNDRTEKEADRIAEQVVGSPAYEPTHDLKRCSIPKGADATPMHPPTIQTQSTAVLSGNAPEVSTDLESHIDSIHSGGEPLSSAVRAYMEPRFGHDFSRVRIHTKASAASTVSTARGSFKNSNLGEHRGKRIACLGL